jgi:SAM-dependent methyltransferase/uncharacterized protein YbaR (Trm112 family)
VTALELVACPKCGAAVVGQFSEWRGDHVLEGTLRCCGCGSTYPITRGVPRMNTAMAGLENVASTFGYEWKAHHAGRFEDETLFGRTIEEDWQFLLDCMGIGAPAVQGSVFLDAGCGSGRFTKLVAERGAEAVVGLDINEAVDEAFELCGSMPNAHIVQGNVHAPPLRRAAFDLVWSSGVLHHTPDASAGHRALAPLVKPGGTFYVWVYAKRFNPFRLVKTVFDAMRLTRLPLPALEIIARQLSYPSWLLLQSYRTVRRVPPLRPRGAWALRTVRPRSLREIQLTWFDALAPEHDSRHTEEEVVEWFRRAGFEHIEPIQEPKVGVRGKAPVRRV